MAQDQLEPQSSSGDQPERIVPAEKQPGGPIRNPGRPPSVCFSSAALIRFWCDQDVPDGFYDQSLFDKAALAMFRSLVQRGVDYKSALPNYEGLKDEVGNDGLPRTHRTTDFVKLGQELHGEPKGEARGSATNGRQCLEDHSRCLRNINRGSNTAYNLFFFFKMNRTFSSSV